uniref:JmjC domain-containing protein n=1 Tax=Caenorhabditis japonica TaxID=281687 RepID=A0A8R1HPH8_CAEJA
MGRIDEKDVPLRQLAWLIHENLPGTSNDVIHPAFCASSDLEVKPGLRDLSQSQSVPIEECNDTDEDSFEKLCAAVHSAEPLLVRGLATNMPAFEKWSFPYLLEELHSRTFPVEIGTKYSDEEWSQKMMTFKDFLENAENQRLYLAQHRLFDQVPHLKRDVIIPDICFSESINPDVVDMNMWIGPEGTVSPLHTDPRKNMFVQMHGTKVFRMVAPEDSEAVYPFDGMLSNTSQVDVEHPDLTAHPDFAEIRVFDATVNAGDALFIPKTWWHYVRSVTPSISVSFWFD